MERPFLDAHTVTRDRTRWRPIARTEAVRLCRHHPVAVLHRIQSREAAAWLDGDPRFFKSDGPYLYEGLRYFLYTGALQERALIGLRQQPKPEAEELEPMEVLDMTGEAVNLGSPVKKPKEKKPIEFQLMDGAGKPYAGLEYEVVLPDGTARRGKTDDKGLVKFPDNIHPGEATLKVFPDHDHHPADASRGPGSPSAVVPTPEPGLIAELGAIPELGLPEIPDIPSIPEIPDVPQPKIPVEILLADAKGLPMPNAAFTAEFPDGKIERGHSDATGMIRFPDNAQFGELLLKLPELEGKPA
jgi:hypothetical protein